MTQEYVDVFHKIDSSSNQYLMVLESDEKIIGTCAILLMPSLTFAGRAHMQLTTNKERTDALRFYEKLGFKAIYEDMTLYMERA
jgi:hypothetical protein